MSGTFGQAPQQPQGQPGAQQQPSMVEQAMPVLLDMLAQIAEAAQMQAQATQAMQSSVDRAMQAMLMVAQVQTAPRRIIMDAQGNPMGVEPVL